MAASHARGFLHCGRRAVGHAEKASAISATTASGRFAIRPSLTPVARKIRTAILGDGFFFPERRLLA
jgi:hypothetical protein